MKQFHRVIKIGLILTLISTLSMPGFSRGKVAHTTSAVADAVALLPASDAVAVVDVARLVSELLPQLRVIAPDQAAKFEREISEFMGETGIDPYKIRSAVIGLKMSESNSVSAIIEGISFDPNRLLATIKAKENKQEVKLVDYKGKQVFVMTSTQAEKAGVNEDLAFTQLDSERVALGTLSGVKSVLDGGNGAANATLTSLLGQTNNGLLRFAANIPENARKSLTGQGDMFAQFSTIKTVFGSLDLTGGLSLLLDTKLRTGSSDEAQTANQSGRLSRAGQDVFGWQ